ncbi:MAG TPA: MFS transporter [Methanocella sp.]|jgi:multidrug resistance protein
MTARSRQLAVLVGGNFFLTLGFSIIMPILPYYSNSMGASALDLGLLMAIYSVMQFLVTPFWGHMSDRVGRKPIFLIGLFGYGFSFLIYGVATQLWMLFAARALGGLIAGGIYPASLAYIADVTEPQERGRIMGLLGAASGVGMIFGPSVAGILAAWGLTVPFFATAVAAIAFGIAGYFLLKESHAVSVHRLQAKIRIVDPLQTPLGVMFLLTMLVTFLISGFQGIFAYYMLGRFGMIETPSPMPLLNGSITVTGPTVMAILFTVMGIAGVLCQGVLVGRFITFFGERKTILIGMIVSSASFFLLLLAPELISLMFFASTLSVGTGLATPCINGLVSGKTAEERQGAVMGVLGSYSSLGRIAGPPAGGLAYDINIYLPYLLSGILSAAGAIAISLANRRKR